MYIAILIIYILVRELIYYKTKKEFNLVLANLNADYNKLSIEKQQLEKDHDGIVKEAREDSLKRSKHVMRGQATEHLAPLMISDWNHKDFRFIGSPIDYLICDGASAILDKQATQIKQVILLDIKTGNASLTKVQRAIRSAIEEGRVSFATYNPDSKQLKLTERKT